MERRLRTSAIAYTRCSIKAEEKINDTKVNLPYQLFHQSSSTTIATITINSPTTAKVLLLLTLSLLTILLLIIVLLLLLLMFILLLVLILLLSYRSAYGRHMLKCKPSAGKKGPYRLHKGFSGLSWDFLTHIHSVSYTSIFLLLIVFLLLYHLHITESNWQKSFFILSGNDAILINSWSTNKFHDSLLGSQIKTVVKSCHQSERQRTNQNRNEFCKE